MNINTDMRSRIVETAERLFRVYGYQKTTVADIAKELKMSPANVYRFFQSKMELTEAVAHMLMGQVETAVTAIARDESQSAAARLRQFFATLFRMNAERYIADNKMHEMCAVAMNENWPFIEAHIERIAAILAEIIADGIRSGEFPPGDPKVLATCVHKSMLVLCHPMMVAQIGTEKAAALLPLLSEFAIAALRHGVEISVGASDHAPSAMPASSCVP